MWMTSRDSAGAGAEKRENLLVRSCPVMLADSVKFEFEILKTEKHKLIFLVFEDRYPISSKSIFRACN
jgi:hypothetical protein